MHGSFTHDMENEGMRYCKAIFFIACLLLSPFLSFNAAGQSGAVTTSTTMQTGTLYPPAPTQYFNDYSGITSANAQAQLNEELAEFDTKNKIQVVVAIFNKKDAPTPLDDYCTAMFNRWGIGKKDNNHGVVLFVFVEKHLLNITTTPEGESILPDRECQKIIEQLSRATFRKYRCGVHLSSAVDAILDGILINQKPKMNGTSGGP